MENNILLEKVSKLPDNLKSEVVDFIDFLLLKLSKDKSEKNGRCLEAEKVCLL